MKITVKLAGAVIHPSFIPLSNKVVFLSLMNSIQSRRRLFCVCW